MATYYFLGGSTGGGTSATDWYDSSNWYDASSGGSSGYSPTSSDDVVILALVDTSGSTPTVNAMTIDSGGTISISVNVTNTCSVLSGGRLAQGTLTGNVSCDGGIVGYATGATIGPTITGDLTFINGGLTDADTGYPINVNGNVYFNNGWYSSASYITVGTNVYYQYGYTGTASNLTVTGGTYYTNYPTLYFDTWNGIDFDWGNAQNWWVDSGYSQQADSIPTSTQDVILDSDVTSDSSGTATANNITVNYNGTNTGRLLISVTVVSTTIFSNDTFYGDGTTSMTLTSPTVTFNGDSYLATGASIVGDVNFYDTSANNGSITGNATVHYSHAVPFNSSNGNNGTISGTISYSGYPTRTVYFYHTDSNLSGRDWGDANSWYTSSGGSNPATYVPNGIISKDNVIIESSISGNTSNIDTTVGSLVVNDHPSAYSTYILSGMSITCDYANFNDSSVNRGTIIQSSSHGSNSIIFNDLSNNDTSGTVEPYTADNVPVEFRDGSSNDGTIDGDAEVYYPSEKPIGGTVNGIVTYFGYTLYFGGMSNDGNWNNPNNWYLDQTHSSAYNDIPSDIIPYQDVILNASVTSSDGPPTAGTIEGIPSANDLSFYITSPPYPYIDNINIDIFGLATFNEDSYLGSTGTITGDALFEDLATNRGGTITGTATFALSAAEEMISNGYDGTYGDIEFQYGKGVNGSSILGIV